MITPKQIATVQTARRRLGIDEPDFREILRAVGNVQPREGRVSTKYLTQTGFERVMAHFENRGFKRHPRQPGDYWRSRQFRRGVLASEREVHKIRSLINQQSTYSLAGMCLRISGGAIDQPEKLPADQARKLIEALKQIIARESAGKDAPPAPGKDATGTDAGAGSIAPRPGVATVVHGSPSPTGVRVGQEWTSQRDPGADWFD